MRGAGEWACPTPAATMGGPLLVVACSIPASVVAEGSVVVRWMRGDVSNLEYLLYLNWAAGRLPNDPFNHPVECNTFVASLSLPAQAYPASTLCTASYKVVPWVTDFSRARGGWRDLSKSKFRLHKVPWPLPCCRASLH